MFPLGVLRSQQQESYNPSLCFGLYHFDGSIGWTIFSDQSSANRTLQGDGATFSNFLLNGKLSKLTVKLGANVI